MNYPNVVPLLTSRRSAQLAFIVLLLALTGCATSPKVSLPAVQQAVASRSGLNATWPQTPEEKDEAERTVAVLVAQELTPDSAVQIAVLNNRELRATFEELGVSQADLIAASRLRNPSFGASVRWPTDRPRGPNVEFSLVSDLLDGLLLPVRKRVAREQLGQAERRVAQAVLVLAADVEAAAYTVQAREQFRTRLASIADVNDAAADLAQRQYDAGNINRLELGNQQVAAQQAHLELMRADAQLRSDREKFNRLLGLSSAQANWKIAANLPELPDVDVLPENLEDLAVNQRLDLAASKSQVALAEDALHLKQKTRLLPASVDLGVDTERDPNGARVTGPRVELGLPIFDQGQADLARLGAEVRRATASFEGLASDIRSQVREARDVLTAAHAAADFYLKTLLPQRRLLLRETLLHYNAMQKSSYELLAAKERLLAAERESIEAVRDYWIARAALEMALGGRLPAASKTPATPKTESDAAVPADHEHLHGKN
jgi:cobalt-zinc-cadmium efflux system outer membrane protein